MPELCSYTLRHSFATRMLQAGVDSHVVAKLMGHTSTRMLEQRYSHIDSKPGFLLGVLNGANTAAAVSGLGSLNLKAMKVGGTDANRPATFARPKALQAAVAAEVIDRIHAHAQSLRGLPDRQRLGVGLRIARQHGCQGENSRGWTVKSL